MMLKSQQVRSLSPEMDPLRMGMGWTVDDLSKPQIMWRAPTATAIRAPAT